MQPKENFLGRISMAFAVWIIFFAIINFFSSFITIYFPNSSEIIINNSTPFLMVLFFVPLICAFLQFFYGNIGSSDQVYSRSLVKNIESLISQKKFSKSFIITIIILIFLFVIYIVPKIFPSVVQDPYKSYQFNYQTNYHNI